MTTQKARDRFKLGADGEKLLCKLQRKGGAVSGVRINVPQRHFKIRLEEKEVTPVAAVFRSVKWRHRIVVVLGKV